MTIHMPKINISNSGGGGGGGETTEVYLTDMQRDYPVHPVSRGDKFYDTEDKVIVTSLIDNPAGYVWEFCSRETPTTGMLTFTRQTAVFLPSSVVQVIVQEPSPTACTTPFWSTVATDGLDVDHVIALFTAVVG